MVIRRKGKAKGQLDGRGGWHVRGIQALSLMAVLAFVLWGCSGQRSSSEKGSGSTTKTTETVDAEKQDVEVDTSALGLESLLLEVVQDIRPGTAGSSLRIAFKTAELLRWCDDTDLDVDEIYEAVHNTMITMDEDEISTFRECMEGISTYAKKLREGDNSAIEELEDAGWKSSVYTWSCTAYKKLNAIFQEVGVETIEKQSDSATTQTRYDFDGYSVDIPDYWTDRVTVNTDTSEGISVYCATYPDRQLCWTEVVASIDDIDYGDIGGGLVSSTALADGRYVCIGVVNYSFVIPESFTDEYADQTFTEAEAEELIDLSTGGQWTLDADNQVVSCDSTADGSDAGESADLASTNYILANVVVTAE